MDKVFKALADPGRRRLLDRLHADNGQTLGQLCETSRHEPSGGDQTPEAAGGGEPRGHRLAGREKLHYLNPVPILEIADRWIGKYERGRLRALAELKKRLEDDDDG